MNSLIFYQMNFHTQNVSKKHFFHLTGGACSSGHAQAQSATFFSPHYAPVPRKIPVHKIFSLKLKVSSTWENPSTRNFSFKLKISTVTRKISVQRIISLKLKVSSTGKNPGKGNFFFKLKVSSTVKYPSTENFFAQTQSL